MADIFRTLIVPSAQVTLANQIAGAFGPGGVNTWTTALSATGSNPATHYIASGAAPEQFMTLPPCKHYVNGQVVSTDPGNAQAVYQAVSSAGVSCTLADIEALFAAADVSDQEPFDALDRLGLQIINPPME